MRTWALAIALVLVSVGAYPAALRASDGVPLPGDVRIMPPHPGLSDEAAYLLGTWEGEWRTSLGVEPEAEILLVVEALNPIKGKARVVYAWNWKTDSPLAPPAHHRLQKGALRIHAISARHPMGGSQPLPFRIERQYPTRYGRSRGQNRQGKADQDGLEADAKLLRLAILR